MTVLVYTLLGLKAWMLVDAVQRGAGPGWYAVIVCVPLGSVAYLALVVAPDRLPIRFGVRRRPRRPSLEQVRYRYAENPCLANEVALARALYDAGSVPEAMEHYRSVLRRDDRYQRALYGLALCHRSRGEAAEAVEKLRRLVELDRSYGDYRAWLDLAEALAATGEVEKAIECLEGLVAAAPRLDHSVALAEVLAGAGRVDEARRRLEAALVDYRHAPRYVRRQFRRASRQAGQMLGRLA